MSRNDAEVLFQMWDLLNSCMVYIEDKKDNFKDVDYRRMNSAYEHIRKASLAVFPIAYKNVTENL